MARIGGIQLHFLSRLAREEELVLDKVFQIGIDALPDSRLSLELTIRGYAVVLLERHVDPLLAKRVWKIRHSVSIDEMKEIYDSAILGRCTLVDCTGSVPLRHGDGARPRDRFATMSYEVPADSGKMAAPETRTTT